MGLTITALGIYQTGKIALPLLRAGYKMVRAQIADSKEPGEVESAVQDILGERIKTLVDGKLASLSAKQLEATDDALVRFTGLVLQSLVKEALTQSEFTEVKDKLTAGLPELPRCWGMFVAQGIPGMQPLIEKDFLLALQAAHDGSGTSPTVEPALLSTFFTQWFQHGVSDVLWKQGWQQKLAEVVCPWLTAALADTLITDHPVALTAFRESMLRFQTERSVKLGDIDKRTKEIAKKQKSEGRKSTRRHKELTSGISKVEAMLVEQTAPGRLAAYKRALVAAFSAYQELAIDNYAAADQACPDIWDIFVHPACSAEHLRPEDMDAAQRETPPRLPTQDLLPLLAHDDYRRTVLLADPGMGKSTIIQALIAHLASRRPLPGAPVLTGLLPVPLILRDLVPLLPQNEVESWTWDRLITVLIEHYQREETAPLLCDAYKDHREEFYQLLHSDPKLFFLIDGLDEIGDLAKRRKIVECIQDGIKAVSKEARWLITSRVIGYDAAPVDIVDLASGFSFTNIQAAGGVTEDKLIQCLEDWTRSFLQWSGYLYDPPHSGHPPTFIEAALSASLAKALVSEAFPSNRNFIFYREQRVAQRLHLSPFDNQRQDAFTSRWFRHRHSTDFSKELMREVRAHHHDGVRIISRVPNLLCMMNMLKRSGKPLPDGRAALYDEIVKAYLGGIDAAYKMQPILGNTCPFEPAERRFLLSLLGALMQKIRLGSEKGDKDGNILIAMPELAQLLLPAIESMQQAGKVTRDHSATALLDELLHHIASRSGLLIPRSSDADGNTVYSFTHLSFMEFFAAEWLGMEFDRRQRQLARHSEALLEDMQLTAMELEQIFPPPGPIQHSRESFKNLPALPAWHEPLIFLLETRKADAPTLLRWLFPALHTTNREQRTEKQEPAKPLLPLDAVRLLVKLTADPEIPISSDKRQTWWLILWDAYLSWPHLAWESRDEKNWPVASLLLERTEHRQEVLDALIAVLPEYSGKLLILYECTTLTSEDLRCFAGVDGLLHLSLAHCTGLKDTAWLVSLRQLEILDLGHCSCLKGSQAFQGLAGMKKLKTLNLFNCPGLIDTAPLAELSELEMLDLGLCTGLHGTDALHGLENLSALKELYLSNCTSIENLPDLRSLRALRLLNLTGCRKLKNLDEVRRQLPTDCVILGPHGERL